MADRIIIVAGDDSIAAELGAWLSRLGFVVLGQVTSGEAALSLALQERPDLVLMDVRLQGAMDGIEAARLIKQRLDVPFVFLTACAEEATLSRIRPIEPHAFVTKPLEERSLSLAVTMALQGHRAARARAEAERARCQADARHKAILDHTHDAIISVNFEYVIELFNKGAERIFGYTADEIVGQPLDVLLPEALVTAHRRHFHDFRATGNASRAMSGNREVVGRRRSGAEFHAEVTISRLTQEGDEIFIACIRDVSERRTLEAQFIRAQKMEAVGRLAASVAHDFNNLLAALQANVYLLKRQVPADLQEPVREISAALERGVALTRQLTGFSRQDLVQRQRVGVNDLVRQATPLLRHMVREGVELRMMLDTSAGNVLVAGNLIEQVLMNLVVNARDALPTGGEIVIRTGTRQITAPDNLPAGRYVRIDVTDSGPGVPAELQDRIFEPFFTTKPEGMGTGLGLSTVRTVARRSGGDVRLTRTSKGCTFTVLLPQVDGEPKTPGSSRPGLVASDSETILLAEDDAALLRSISRILKLHGYRVLEANGFEAALALANEKGDSIDLVLTDVIMPNGSGRELARVLLRRWPQLPIVLMTGFCEGLATSEPGLLDGLPLLQKPIVPDLLLHRLREVLDGREQLGGSSTFLQGAK